MLRSADDADDDATAAVRAVAVDVQAERNAQRWSRLVSIR